MNIIIILRIVHDGSFKLFAHANRGSLCVTDIYAYELKTNDFSVKNLEKIGFKNISEIVMFVRYKTINEIGLAGQYLIYKQ